MEEEEIVIEEEAGETEPTDELDPKEKKIILITTVILIIVTATIVLNPDINQKPQATTTTMPQEQPATTTTIPATTTVMPATTTVMSDQPASETTTTIQVQGSTTTSKSDVSIYEARSGLPNNLNFITVNPSFTDSATGISYKVMRYENQEGTIFFSVGLSEMEDILAHYGNIEETNIPNVQKTPDSNGRYWYFWKHRGRILELGKNNDNPMEPAIINFFTERFPPEPLN